MNVNLTAEEFDVSNATLNESLATTELGTTESVLTTQQMTTQAVMETVTIAVVIRACAVTGDDAWRSLQQAPVMHDVISFSHR